MARLGHKPSNKAPGCGEMLAGRARATYLGYFNQNVWATKVGIRMGRNTSSAAQAAPAFWNVNSNNAPTTLFYSPPTKSITAYMAGNDPMTGTNYEWPVTNLPIASGHKLAGGPWADDGAGSIAYGQDNSGAMMYFDNSATSVPNPFNISSSSPEGKISVWIEAEPNRAPNTPEVVEPVPNTTTIDTTPTIKVKFHDPDIAYGDQLAKYKIEIWNEANTTRLQASGVQNATSQMKSDRVAEWTASTLSAGTYTVRATLYDHFGTPSPTVMWKFSINAGGAASMMDLYGPDKAGTRPNGVRVMNTARPGGTARWDHQSGADALRYWIRIVKPFPLPATVVRSAVLIDNDKEDGELFAYGFASGWADLPADGTLFNYEIQFEDEFNSLSPWTTGPFFEINAAPVIAPVGPADGKYVVDPPTLSASAYDPNDDTASLTMTCEVRPKGGGSTVTVPVTPSTQYEGLYFAQATTSHMPNLVTYEWRFIATDPWGASKATDWQEVTRTTAPTLNVASPSGTITTGAPFVDWTLDRTQTKYRVRIWGKDTSILYWDSGLVSSSTTSVTVPAGKLRNNIEYDGEVYVETADGLNATKTFTFKVQYTAPSAMSNVTFTTVASSIYDGAQPGLAAQEPNVKISWDKVDTTTVSDADWIGYVIYREVDGQAIETLITNRDQTEFIDTTPLHQVAYDYHVTYRKYINAGVDTIEATPVTQTMSVAIQHTTITSLNPDEPAVTLHYWEDRTVPLQTDVVLVEVLGQEKRIGFQGVRNDERVEGEFIAVDDRSGSNLFTAQDVVEDVKDLARPMRDEHNRPRPRRLFYRDPKGRGFPIVLVAVTNEDAHQHNLARMGLVGEEVEDERTVVTMGGS